MWRGIEGISIVDHSGEGDGPAYDEAVVKGMLAILPQLGGDDIWCAGPTEKKGHVWMLIGGFGLI